MDAVAQHVWRHGQSIHDAESYDGQPDDASSAVDGRSAGKTAKRDQRCCTCRHQSNYDPVSLGQEAVPLATISAIDERYGYADDEPNGLYVHDESYDDAAAADEPNDDESVPNEPSVQTIQRPAAF